MISRRNLILSAAAGLITAPAVVRAASLMPARSIMAPEPALHFGFVSRLYAHSCETQIVKLQDAGFSLVDIASKLNGRGSRAMNGERWDIERVTGVMRLADQIRRSDRRRAAETSLRGYW